MTNHTWRITVETKYHNNKGYGWDTIHDQTWTGDGPGLEDHVQHIVADTLIGADDERYEGPGDPISTTIRIHWIPRPAAEQQGSVERPRTSDGAGLDACPGDGDAVPDPCATRARPAVRPAAGTPASAVPRAPGAAAAAPTRDGPPVSAARGTPRHGPRLRRCP